MTVVPLREEKMLRPQEFVDHLGEVLGVPAPSTRWLRSRINDGMPSRLVLKRYRMIPVEPATNWLRDKGYL
jgi:hypothetical protein